MKPIYFNELNEYVKAGYINVSGLLCQSAMTIDGVIKLEGIRIGGGFTMGYSVHKLYKEDKLIPLKNNLERMYLYMLIYCRKNFKLN